MGYPIFHGMKLANGARAENFHFESLAADPVPLSEGRIWFNATEKAFKFSSLTALGAVATHSFGSAAELTAAIDTLTTNLNAEIAARTSAITAEQTARIAAVTDLQNALAQEVADRTNGDSTEAAARIAGDSAEAAARTAAIAVAAATAADATSTEAAARLAGDAAANTRIDSVQAELDATQAGAGLDVSGAYVAPLNTAYLGLTTTLKGADVALDTAISNEVTRATGVEGALSSAIANEAQQRADADTALQTQITAWVNVQVSANASADLVEQAARIAADTALQNELDATQAAIGLATDGTLIPITGTNYLNAATTVFGGAFILDTQLAATNAALAAEVSARTLADTNFNTSLNAEITDRTAADVAMQTELNTTQTGAGLETTGAYLALVGSNYLGLATSLKDADSILDAALKAVSDRVGVLETTAIPNLQSQITAEVNRATAAETANNTQILANAAAIATETTRATTAEGTLTTNLSAEVTARTSGDANLQAQINTLTAGAGAGAAALQTTLNAKRYTYKSTTPALVHTITHNLNTDFYSAQIMVEDGLGVWRNDIVPVEDINLNSFKVTLSVAANIKVSGQSNDQLA